MIHVTVIDTSELLRAVAPLVPGVFSSGEVGSEEDVAKGIADVNVAVARKLAHDATEALGATRLEAVVPLP